MRYLKTAVLAGVMTVFAVPAFAQHGPGRSFGHEGMRDRALGVEAALRMREELKLSSAQVNQLESLRKEIVTQRQNAAREMIDLRSRIAAGNLDREDARKQLEARRDEMRKTMQQRREQFERILSEDQRAQLSRVARMHMRERRDDRGPGRGFRGPPRPPRDRYRWQ